MLLGDHAGVLQFWHHVVGIRLSASGNILPGAHLLQLPGLARSLLFPLGSHGSLSYNSFLLAVGFQLSII